MPGGGHAVPRRPLPSGISACHARASVWQQVGPDFLLNGWPDTVDAHVANDRVAVKKELHGLIVNYMIHKPSLR